jgi:DNA-binding MarR family transcriptional regulator
MPRKIPLDKELPNAAGDPSRIPLPALMELAVDAMWVDFRVSLVEAGITDIRPSHGCVFRFLHGDGMRLTELASLAGLTKQSVGEIVDDLTALGYIERYPDPTDKRAKLIRLTKKGKDAQAVGFNLFSELESEWADAFGGDEIADLRALLERVALAKAPAAVPEIVRPDPALIP